MTSTCHEDEDTKQIIYNSGSQIILSKPLNKADLEQAMKKIHII